MLKKETGKGDVSVVIPTHNRPQYIARSIASLLAQELPPNEIIVIDDGSEETLSQQLIEELSPFDGDIIFHQLPMHRGVGAARNKGLELASSEFIVFLDDDDLLHPKMLQLQVEELIHDPSLSVAICLHQDFTNESKETFHSISRRAEEENRYSFVPEYLLSQQPRSAFLRYNIPINACVLRRKSIGSTRFLQGYPVGEDTYFFMELACKGLNFSLLPFVGAYVRRHDKNVSTAKGKLYPSVIKVQEKLLQSYFPLSTYDTCLTRLRLMRAKLILFKLSALGEFFHVLKSPFIAFQILWTYLRQFSQNHITFSPNFQDEQR